MWDEGLLSDDARVIATHLAHETNPPHQELAEIAAKHGCEARLRSRLRRAHSVKREKCTG
jgi:hypothetical protein